MNELNLMYLFTFEVSSKTEKQGIKLVKPLAIKCSDFAKSLDVIVGCDYFGFFDNSLSMRMTFNIKGSQESILLKVASLFAFAATHKLTLINQEFLAEKP